MPKFELFLGEGVAAIFAELESKASKLSKEEKKFVKKLKNALNKLAENPAYNSLQSHKIDVLSAKYGIEIWQSYIENNVSGAQRIFWYYGPERGQLTILGLEKHPNKSHDYRAIEIEFPQGS